jgi:CDP-glycerol glycerophosphotransferase (TagB/SpsB family)
MKKIDWSDARKTSWPYNALMYNLRKLVPGRENTLWVFGGREGHQYDDNSRHLFEYMNRNHKDKIRCVWLCEKQELADHVKSYGYEAYTFESEEGISVARKAGVAVYSHGLIDFGIHPQVGGALVVSLWHGVGFKKVYNGTYHGISYVAKKIMDKVFAWTNRDLTIVTSDVTKDMFALTFDISKTQIRIAGQPRNDIFKNHYKKKDVLKKLSVDYTKKVILYMPTYRGKGMGEGAMENIVKDLYHSEKLNKALTDSNSIFFAKLHPLTPHIDLPNRDNFVIMDYGAIESNQELLSVGDMMITDYSSVCVDYALTERPVLFYMPDHEKFITLSEPLFDEFYDMCKFNQANNPEQLADLIANPTMEATYAINNIFEAPEIKGTCYCENVYNAIIKEIGRR